MNGRPKKARPRKLTDEQVRQIREWYAARLKLPPAREVMRKHGIKSSSNFYQIAQGTVYKVLA